MAATAKRAGSLTTSERQQNVNEDMSVGIHKHGNFMPSGIEQEEELCRPVLNRASVQHASARSQGECH